MIDSVTLGKRIKAARTYAGFTQKELGERLEPKRSVTAVSYIENGISRVFVQDLIKISEVTEFSLFGWFLAEYNGS